MLKRLIDLLDTVTFMRLFFRDFSEFDRARFESSLPDPAHPFSLAPALSGQETPKLPQRCVCACTCMYNMYM